MNTPEQSQENIGCKSACRRKSITFSQIKTQGTNVSDNYNRYDLNGM